MDANRVELMLVFFVHVSNIQNVEIQNDKLKYKHKNNNANTWNLHGLIVSRIPSPRLRNYWRITPHSIFLLEIFCRGRQTSYNICSYINTRSAGIKYR